MLETRLRSTSSTSSPLINGGVIGGTSGSVLFVDSSGNLAQDNSNFFWNDTDNALVLSGTSAATLTSATNKDFNISANGTGHLWLASNNFRLLTTGFGSTIFEMDSSGRWGLNASPSSSQTFLILSDASTRIPLVLRMAATPSVAGLEVQNDSGTALFRLTPDTVTDEGGLALHLFARSLQDRGLVFDPGGANTRPKISTLASAGFNLNDGAMFGPSFSDESLPNFIPDGIRFGRDVGNYSIRWSPRANDTATYSLSMTGQEAYTSATSTNQNGGAINITGGTASSDSGKTGAGGNVVINGGVKSPSGTDGNVILASSRGNVGIGTESPATQLHLQQGASTAVGLLIKGHNSNNSNWIEGRYANDTLRFRVDVNGNVTSNSFQSSFTNASATIINQSGTSSAALVTMYNAAASATNIVLDAGGSSTFTAATSSTTPLKIKGAPSQSENAFEYENSSGTDLVFISAAGDITAGNGTTTIKLGLNGGTPSLVSSSGSIIFQHSGSGAGGRINFGFSDGGGTLTYNATNVAFNVGFNASSSGNMNFQNAASYVFDSLIKFSGTTSSFPALKRSSAILQARLADDSAYTDIEVADEAYGSGWNGSLEVPTKNAVYDQVELKAPLASPALTGTVTTQAFEPATDNTYYLGKNDDDTPKAWKGLILKDQTTGTYYRLQIDSGVVTLVDLTD